MTRYMTFKAGLAGITLFLSIIAVVSEDAPSTGSPTFNTTANATYTENYNVTTTNSTESIPVTETSQPTHHKVPIVQLPESVREIEELILDIHNRSVHVEVEGSGDEPTVTSSDEFTMNSSTAQTPTLITTQVVTEVAENSSEHTPMTSTASSLDILMPEVVTTETVDQLVEPAPTSAALVIQENVTETTTAASGMTTLINQQVEPVTTSAALVIPENVTETTTAASGMTTLINQEMNTTKVPEITTAGDIISEPQSKNESSISQQSKESTDNLSTSMLTTTVPSLINGTNETGNIGNSISTQLQLDTETAEPISSTALPSPSVSHDPLVTSKEETEEYTTHASSIVEHYVTTERKIHTTVSEPITLAHQSSTQPSLTIGAINISSTTEATTRDINQEIITKTESKTESSTASVLTLVTETTTGTTEKSSGVPTTLNETMELNETRPELSIDEPFLSPKYQETTVSTQMITTPLQSKCYDELSEPEFYNSVTVVFARPPRTKGMLFDSETFKKTVICLINIYELQEWPLTVVNMSDCEEFNETLQYKLLETTALVIIKPSPTPNNNDIIVTFFTRNTTAEYSGQIVSRNRTLTVLNNHKEYLMNQMGMNITEIYGGMRVSHLVLPSTDPFYMRHSLLLIILAVTSGVCILIIISGLIYIKCRITKSKWSSTSSYTQEKSKLQRDILCSEMGQHLNSDDDINKDEALRTMNNGNGFFAPDTGSGSSVTPIGEEDGWVIPYDELSPEEKSSVDVEDTKL